MLYSGLYINELLSRVLAHETDYSPLFYDYLQCLQWLAGVSCAPWRRGLRVRRGQPVKRVSNKLACAIELVYTTTQYRQKSGEGDV